MRKIYLGVIALYLGIVVSHAQTAPPPANDTSGYQSRKLNLDEVNFVSAYYHQNGDNSAVTGGIGTENLTDVANTIEINMSLINKNNNKEHFIFELGIDHYTSASSDMINPDSSGGRNGNYVYALTSASRQDTRIYPSLSWSVDDDKR